jgi:hypothetical protein
MALSAAELDQASLDVFKVAAKALVAVGAKDKATHTLLKSYKSGKGLRSNDRDILSEAIQAADTSLRELEALKELGSEG